MEPQFFYFAVGISMIGRCVISGNMILNEAPRDGGRACLTVNNGKLPSEIAVAGNVLQGTVFILPEPPSVLIVNLLNSVNP